MDHSELVFYAQATGSVQAAVSDGLAQDAIVEVGASYNNGTWTPINQHSSNFENTPPSLDGGLTLKGALGARFDFLVYDMAGPSIGLDIYSQFSADVSQNPWWTWTAGIEGPIAFHVAPFGISLKDYDLGDVFNFSWPVAQANGGFLPSDVAPVLSSVSPTSALVGSTTVNLSLVGSNFVPDSFVRFNGAALPTTFVDANDLTATLPGGLLVLDGVFPITVTNPDTSGAIPSAANFTVTGVLVNVSPPSAQVPASGLQQFTPQVLGPSNNAVTWTVNGVTGGNSTVGTISVTGLYTAPTTVPTPATVTVIATSQAVPTASGSASVTIGPYTEKPIYSFTSLTDGAAPSAALVQGTDGYYYGTAQVGGANGAGTVFKMDSSGNVTPLHDFTNTDGSGPLGALIQASDGYFYGTTGGGGAYNEGTAFKTDSSGNLTTLYSFTGGNDGASPVAALLEGSDGYLYGTTALGGDYDGGTVFKMDTAGNLTTLYSFTKGTDGGLPASALIQDSSGYFYGTTQNGGDLSCGIWNGPGSGCGTVYRIDSAGNITTLYSFTGGTDGANPVESLLQASDGYFYGTVVFGGDPSCTVSGYTGCGTVFKVSSSGNFTAVHEFSGSSEGGVPASSLIQASDGDFYGTATAGGDLSCSVYAAGESYSTYIGCGTVFKMDSAGNVNALYSFAGSPNDGSNPFAGLVQGSDGYFYGTTRWGGTDSSCPYTNNGGCGTVFKVSGPGGPLVSKAKYVGIRFKGSMPTLVTPASQKTGISKTPKTHMGPQPTIIRGLVPPPNGQ